LPAQDFINRELSLLAFNERVLAQAEDASLPLLERLRFLCITSSNLDEFFEVRVAGLKAQMRLNPSHADVDGLPAVETLRRVASRAHILVTRQYALLNDTLLPLLAVMARRLHDAGHSGLWIIWGYLLAFICLIGFIILVVFWCQKSEPGDTKYGPHPAS